jgi:hypothetical protein
MLRRRRPLLRAAAVGGGAYLAGKHRGRQAEQQGQAEAYQDDRISALEDQQGQQQAPPQPSPQAPAAPATSPMVDQLNQLAALHEQGVLTDEEFAAAKAKLLGT